jgi:hypothetical protein
LSLDIIQSPKCETQQIVVFSPANNEVATRNDQFWI